MARRVLVQETDQPAASVTGAGPALVSQAAGRESSSSAVTSSAVLSAGSLRLAGGRMVAVRVRCRARAGSHCNGTLRLVAGRAVIAERSVALSAAHWSTVRLRLSMSGYATLARRHRLTVTAILTTRGPGTRHERISSNLTLTAAGLRSEHQ